MINILSAPRKKKKPMSIYKIIWPFIFVTMIIVTNLVFSSHSQATQASDSRLLKNAISLRQAGKTQQALDILEPLKTQYIDHKRVNIELVMNYINIREYNDAQDIILHLKSLSLSTNESTKLQSLQKKLNGLILNKKSSHSFATELFFYAGIDSMLSKYIYDELDDFYEWEEFSYEGDDMEEYYDEGDYTESYFLDEANLIDSQDNNETNDTIFLGDNTKSEITESEENSYTAQQIKFFHRYQPHQQFTVFGTKNTLRWSNNISIYQQQIDDEFSDNYGQIKMDSTLALLQQDSWLIDFRLRGRYHFNDNRHRLSDQGAQISLTLPFARSQAKIGFEYKKKSFTGMADINDADISIPWLEYSYKLSKQFKVRVGTRYRQKSATDPYNSYDNTNIYMSLIYYDRSYNAFITLSHDQLHYKIDQPELVRWSNEERKSLVAGLKYKLSSHFNLGFNGHFIENNIGKDNQEDEWYRLEGYISYRF